MRSCCSILGGWGAMSCDLVVIWCVKQSEIWHQQTFVAANAADLAVKDAERTRL